MPDQTTQPPQWPDAGEPPAREDLLAAQELADVRRVLSIDVTRRTIVPCHEWVMRVGETPVRLEIAQGTQWPEVERSLIWLMAALGKTWAFAANPIGAMAMAREYERSDLSRGTIDGQVAVSERAFKPREPNEVDALRQQVAALKADNVKLAAVMAAHRDLMTLTVGARAVQKQTEDRPSADAGSNAL